MRVRAAHSKYIPNKLVRGLPSDAITCFHLDVSHRGNDETPSSSRPIEAHRGLNIGSQSIRRQGQHLEMAYKVQRESIWLRVIFFFRGFVFSVFYRAPGKHEGNVYVLLSRTLWQLCRTSGRLTRSGQMYCREGRRTTAC